MGVGVRTGLRIVRRIRRKFPQIGVKWAETIPGDRRHLRLYAAGSQTVAMRWLFDLRTWTATIEALDWE
jgi:hypothetical protein